MLFEEFAGGLSLPLKPGPAKILLHGHCHQKSMGLLPAAKALLEKIPGSTVIDLDAGCCGMAGSFGYSKEHYRRLAPDWRAAAAAAGSGEGPLLGCGGQWGTSCRHQLGDFTDETAVHPAMSVALSVRR